MRGSAHNDAFILEGGAVRTATNRHAGILGGLTTGMPVLFRVAFKPTASIAKPQKTVNLAEHREETIQVGGRHDPCVVPRAVPVVEAMAALGILDLMAIANAL
jgi:chorismate synthase